MEATKPMWPLIVITFLLLTAFIYLGLTVKDILSEKFKSEDKEEEQEIEVTVDQNILQGRALMRLGVIIFVVFTLTYLLFRHAIKKANV